MCSSDKYVLQKKSPGLGNFFFSFLRNPRDGIFYSFISIYYFLSSPRLNLINLIVSCSISFSLPVKCKIYKMDFFILVMVILKSTEVQISEKQESSGNIVNESFFNFSKFVFCDNS
jgi:hypothetical protein